MKAAIAFIVIVPLSVFFIYEYAIHEEVKTATVTPMNEKNVAVVAAPIVTKPLPSKSLPSVSATTPANTLQSDSEFDAINRPSDKAKQVLKAAGVLPTDLKNEAYVEFDLAALRKLKQGDSFDLAIPQTAETFSAEVTNVIAASNGDKSVFGSVIGADGRFHTTVLTIGKDAVYGQFTAPSGNYVFESKGQYGWLAAKRDLYKNHIEHQVTNQPAAQPSEGDDPFAPKAKANSL
ncbi:hypothetical protein [Pseudoalteromonas sp. ASV78]|uniref:hypothetical protein n=1 Tax=Pseudoalteromonas sp. ASV78 TaxID=3397851 RepID=UPI0039FCCF3E